MIKSQDSITATSLSDALVTSLVFLNTMCKGKPNYSGINYKFNSVPETHLITLLLFVNFL